MPAEATWLAAFLAGMLGSVHCIGMCGGITGAFTMALPAPVRQSWARLFPYLLAYNTGRIASYMTAGAVLGFAGLQFGYLVDQDTARLAGRVISGLFMLALGLYLAGWWQALSVLERLGGRLWRHIEPLGRRFLPPRGPLQALGLGVVWGWLPCGMVYSLLAWSAAAGGAASGAQLMLAFGLGTLPMLLAMGSAAQQLTRVTRLPMVRQVAGAVIMLFAGYMLLAPTAHQGHDTSGPHTGHGQHQH